MTDMHALRTLGILAFGFSFPLAVVADLDQSRGLLAYDLKAAAEQIIGVGHARIAAAATVAEVAVAFDDHGHVTESHLRRSSGSERSDAAALNEAVELASLRRPSDVAGRTLLFRERFEGVASMVD
jgi:hypothetical protein